MRANEPLVRPCCPGRPFRARGMPVPPIGRAGPRRFLDRDWGPRDRLRRRKSRTVRSAELLTVALPVCPLPCSGHLQAPLESAGPQRPLVRLGMETGLEQFHRNGNSRIRTVATASPPLDSGRVAPLAPAPGNRFWSAPWPGSGEHRDAPRRGLDLDARCTENASSFERRLAGVPLRSPRKLTSPPSRTVS